MVHPRDIIESILYPENIKSEDFACWAFGEKYKTINFNSEEPVLAWNELHGDILKLYSYGSPEKDLKKMIDIWRKENENQSVRSS